MVKIFRRNSSKVRTDEFRVPLRNGWGRTRWYREPAIVKTMRELAERERYGNE